MHAIAAVLFVTVRTLAGPTNGGGFAEGSGAAARFSGPSRAVVCGGALFAAETGNHVIRRVTADGTVQVWAGTPRSAGNRDGDRSAAQFREPDGIAAAADCTLYVADTGNGAVRRISTNGIVSTVASGFSSPQDLAVDGTGDVYVSDTGRNRISVIRGGAVSTLATGFNSPRGLGLDTNGDLLVCDFQNNALKRVTPSGTVTTIVRDLNYHPADVAVTADGAIYATDEFGQRLIRLGADSQWSVVAGKNPLPGADDGVGEAARFDYPHGVAADPGGSLWVTDWRGCTVRRVSPAGEVRTVAGSAPPLGIVDATGEAARFAFLTNIAVAPDGTVYVIDPPRVRKIDPSGAVSLLAGSGERGSVDGVGEAARFDGPGGIAVAPNGDVIISDVQANTIRRITPAGVVTTIAGSPGKSGFTDGAGGNARFNYPAGVDVTADGTIYIADTLNRAIRKISGSVVTTIPHDRTGLSTPTDLEVDPEGNIWFWDENVTSLFRVTPSGTRTTIVHTDNFGEMWSIARASDGSIYVGGWRVNHIFRITPAGAVEIWSGERLAPGNQNGPLSLARYRTPRGLDVGPDGRLYIADSGNGAVRVVVEGDPPSIASFTATPSTVRANENVTLSWSSTGGTTARIDPHIGAVALSGSITFAANATTHYTLTVSNEFGETTAKATVMVKARYRPVRRR